jgi:hypothetical protein
LDLKEQMGGGDKYIYDYELIKTFLTYFSQRKVDLLKINNFNNLIKYDEIKIDVNIINIISNKIFSSIKIIMEQLIDYYNIKNSKVDSNDKYIIDDIYTTFYLFIHKDQKIFEKNKKNIVEKFNKINDINKDNDKFKYILLKIIHNIYKVKNIDIIQKFYLDKIDKKNEMDLLKFNIGNKFIDTKKEINLIKKKNKLTKDEKYIINYVSNYLLFIINITNQIKLHLHDIDRDTQLYKSSDSEDLHTLKQNLKLKEHIPKLINYLRFIVELVLELDIIDNNYTNNLIEIKNIKNINRILYSNNNNIFLNVFEEIKAEEEAKAKAEAEAKAKAESEAKAKAESEAKAKAKAEAKMKAKINENITNNLLIIFIGNSLEKKIYLYENASYYLSILKDIHDKDFYSGHFYIIQGDEKKNKILNIIEKHLINKQNIVDYLPNVEIKRNNKKYKYIQIHDEELLNEILKIF